MQRERAKEGSFLEEKRREHRTGRLEWKLGCGMMGWAERVEGGGVGCGIRSWPTCELGNRWARAALLGRTS